ncbi:hypothetical protein EOJ36_07060 [Sandaracinomonas limnophila]|uniref:Uncharacterized protein n=1 Tax=Sandaracinomonas limnophila TaxID=1862386 RepID=A0A437PR81_9BACT|nr:hypothetical protein [Sandaracinomonas limnophila]RVU24765.1 hypothetical protein EOJ36_07060 [Sandaracinomonas limnophila]
MKKSMKIFSVLSIFLMLGSFSSKAACCTRANANWAVRMCSDSVPESTLCRMAAAALRELK